MFKFTLRRAPQIDFVDADGKTRRYKVNKGKTVLDTLLEKGQPIPHSCRAGLCQTCVLNCDNKGALPDGCQKGLTDRQIQKGNFLACLCQPQKNIKIAAIDRQSEIYSANVINKSFVNEHIIRLILSAPFSFKPGQFCHLYKDNTLFRSYSIASTEKQKQLEFHIKRYQNGQFSQWAANELQPGDDLLIEGPYGDCVYPNSENFSDKPLLLCGIGTGLAPIYGILQYALSQGHKGEITFLIGAKSPDQFYYTNELNSLCNKYPNVNIKWIAQSKPITEYPSTDHLYYGDIYNYVETHHTSLSNYHVFLCGATSFVQKMKKQCFLAGASMQNIYADAFTPSS